MWKWAIENGLENKLKSLPTRICLQGEIIGEGIQGNPYRLRGQRVLFFNAIDMEKRRLLSLGEMIELMARLDLPMVPILSTDFVLDHTVPELLELSRGNSTYADTPREGLVFRPLEPVIDARFDVPHARLSFKVINPDFSED
jgi:hypothetical protein